MTTTICANGTDTSSEPVYSKHASMEAMSMLYGLEGRMRSPTCLSHIFSGATSSACVQIAQRYKTLRLPLDDIVGRLPSLKVPYHMPARLTIGLYTVVNTYHTRSEFKEKHDLGKLSKTMINAAKFKNLFAQCMMVL